MGYPSPAVDVRTGAGDPVLNADVVLANAAAVVVATAAAWVVDFAGVVAVEDAVDATVTDDAVLDPATGVLYRSAYSFSC
ncbi:hypothetical protein SCLCIDRAFT_1213259 [Scleroderma citrinum Foug A]|uniref:Uncharacterized protein n=1 Tax=Scleroderma citrinum Foug A TaxID=1036808 RepID=A0A0C3E8X2_9AGAM|nr:hypothetical protein SCLCIDRAFT_1213259 [Scleroderma citrinum Foug A]